MLALKRLSFTRTTRLAWCGGVAVGAVVVWLLCAPTFATSSGSIPPRAVKVAGGHNNDSSWGAWLFGARGQGCWATQTRFHDEVTGESVTCGMSVPSQKFQLASTGTVSAGSAPRSLLFFLVRFPRVKELRVFVRGGGRSPHWVVIGTKGLGPAKRARAKVPARVGFAVKVVAGRSVCPRQVVALDGRNRPIGRGSLPPCGQE